MLAYGEAGYNERLFSGGIRGYLHTARFRYLNRMVKKYSLDQDTVLELGCFDGKSISYLPKPPREYVGFDANWEGGVDLAHKLWADKPEYRFIVSDDPGDIAAQAGQDYDLVISMETLEHLPPEQVDDYLAVLAQKTSKHAIFTVPNEKGVVFAFKHLAKMMLTKGYRHYSFGEFMNATLGRMSKVARDNHKGFDYAALIRQVEKHFEVIEVRGIGMNFLPPILNFNVGMVVGPRSESR